MEINLEKARNEFIEYTNGYDTNEEMIKLKIGHSIRVMEISKKIALSINLEEEKVKIATLIGLLHDIARFEQYTIYKTFSDKESIDHGDLGVKILQENNFLRNFIESDKYDNIILRAIGNHNKYELEKGLNPEEEIFAKIIRDADKIDIFYEAETMFWKDDKEVIENSICTPNILEEFVKCKLIDRRKYKTNKGIDKIVQLLAFIFDINFKASIEIIDENNYIENILNRFDYKKEETKQQVKQIKEITKKYIQNYN